MQRAGRLKPRLICLIQIGKRAGYAADQTKLVQKRQQLRRRLALGLRGGQKRGDGAFKLECHRAGVPFLQCGGQIRTGQGRCAMLRLEANADPVRFSVFLTERPPQLKIDRLPGNDAAQCAADGRPGAGEHRILLDRLPQELGKENRERPVGIPQRAERLEHRQAAEIFLLIEHIDRQRPRALQLQ